MKAPSPRFIIQEGLGRQSHRGGHIAVTYSCMEGGAAKQLRSEWRNSRSEPRVA